jgi:hypothetical protein
MDLTDARTRKKVTLNPRTVLSNSWVTLTHMTTRQEPIASYYRVSGRVATDIVFSNALLVVSLWTVKEWFLSQNVGAFWVLMRILACSALGLSLREVMSGDAPKALATASSAKARTFFFFGLTEGFTMHDLSAYSGLYWPWAPWSFFFNKVASSWRCRDYRQPGMFGFPPPPPPPCCFRAHARVNLLLTLTFFLWIRSVVMFTHFSSVWAKSLSSATWVSTCHVSTRIAFSPSRR